MRIVLAITYCVLLLAAGCSTASRRQPSFAAPVASASAAAKPRPAADYFPDAIERRVEAHARFAAGLLHDFNEETDAASSDYTKAALADLRNEPLVIETSTRLLRFKLPDQAVELLKKATAQKDASGELFAQLGLACALAGKKEEAIAANQMAIAKAPRSLAGYRHLAQLHMQDRKADEALKVLDQAAQQKDLDAAFLTELGEFYLALARSGATNAARAKAVDALKRAAGQETANVIVLQKLADALTVLGENDLAAEIYLKLLNRLPHLPGLREKLVDMFLRKKDSARASEQLKALVRDNPTDFRAYYYLGSIAYEGKQWLEAAEHFEKVILLKAEFEPAYYDLAGAQISRKEPQRALDVLAKARDKFKPSFVCEFFTGAAYNSLKDYPKALKHFTEAEIIARATDTNRLTHVLYFQLGAVCERNQQFQEAEKHFRRSLSLAPDFAETLNYLGYMWADRGENLQEAHEMIAKAVKLEPKNAAFLDSLGWVLFKLGKPKEALPFLLQAVELSEEPDATLHDHLGDVHAALRQVDKAREAWRKSLSLESNEHKAQIQKKLDASLAADKPGSPRSPQ